MMNLDFSDAEEEKKFIASQGMIPYKVTCDICGEIHYQGAGVYPLRKVAGYNLFCCKICYDGNWDGWAPQYEQKLFCRLKEVGVKPPPRNEKGWLPREF